MSEKTIHMNCGGVGRHVQPHEVEHWKAKGYVVTEDTPAPAAPAKAPQKPKAPAPAAPAAKTGTPAQTQPATGENPAGGNDEGGGQ